MWNDNDFAVLEITATSPAEGIQLRPRMGFTLIEIMVVMVIIAIAAAMAVPMFSSAGSVQIRSAADIIAADLEYAKSMAITTGQNYSVVFTNSSSESYHIEDQNHAVIKHPVKKGFNYVENFKSDSRLSKVAITSVQFQPGPSNTVTFDYLGSPHSGNVAANPLDSGNITISAGGMTTTVKVETVTGYITIN